MHSPSNHVAACPLKTPGRPSSSNTQHDNAWAHVKTSDCRASLPSGAAVTSSSVLPPRSGCDQSHAVFSTEQLVKALKQQVYGNQATAFLLQLKASLFRRCCPGEP